MAERVLSASELNRALLERQGLLRRRRRSIPETLRRMGGLQAQYAPSMYIGLWSRIEGLRRESVTRALERRKVVQATVMRATIHLLARDQYWPFQEAVREPRRAWAMRNLGEPGEERMWEAAGEARALLSDGPRPRRDIEAAIGKPEFRGLSLFLDLVRVPPSGTWERRRADLFGLADQWLGPSDACAREGTHALIRSYLGGFGPSSRDEIALFGGLEPEAVDAALEELELRRFRAADDAPLFDIPRAPLPPPGTSAPVRMIATWDAMLLVHARRTQVLPEEYRPRIFTSKRPQSVGTFLVDGHVAGEWKLDGDRVVCEPYEPLPRAARRELDTESRALAAFCA